MRRGLDPRTFLLLGLAAGLLAGLAAFGVAWSVGEPHVDAAIALEEAAAAVADDEHTHSHEEAPLVTRGVQSTIGLLTGSLVIATVLGGLTGLVSALAMGRLGSLRPAASTAVVALLGFVSVGLVPFLKYPANPPAVGDPETINQRTALYFGFLLLCVVAALVAVLVARRAEGYRAAVSGAAVFLGIVVLAAVLLPTVDEVAEGFPASLLWNFRLSSLLTLATMWGVIGVALTGLVGRASAQAAAAQQRRELAASL